MGIGQLSVLQPEIRRTGQCDFDTPERRNRMLCQPKSSREASHSATETRRLRVEMLCEFRVGGMAGGLGYIIWEVRLRGLWPRSVVDGCERPPVDTQLVKCQSNDEIEVHFPVHLYELNRLIIK